MRERVSCSVGSYPPDKVGAVTEHALAKGIPFETYKGPLKDFLLPSGLKITVDEGMTAVVLAMSDLEEIQDFWYDFGFPKDK